MLRSAGMATTLVEFGVDRGLHESRCLEGSGLDRRMLGDARAEITSEQELVLVRNIVSHLGGDSGLGLEVGKRVHATTYGVLGLGLLSSANVGAALALAARNADLCMTLSDLGFGEQRGDHVTEFDDVRVPSDVRRFLFERDMTIYTRFFTESVDADLRPARVDCRLPPPAPEIADRYTSVFGVRPWFRQATNLVVYRARDLSRPMPQAHRQTAQLAEQLCGEVKRRRVADASITTQVQDLLRRAPGGRLAQEAVAASLAMSPRSLRKHLMDEGTSYRQLLQAATIEHARDMLAAGLTVEETTWRLGYSEAAAFSRAFKHRTGSSPGAYARAMQDRPKSEVEAA
jgi:AraC-like DNA-binding protein